MFWLSVQNNFYITSSLYVEEHVKNIFSLNSYLRLVPKPQKSRYFFWNLTVEQVLKSFSDRNNSLKPPCLEFIIVFHIVWKNQESWEPWSDGYWSNRHSYMQKSSAKILFFTFLSLPLSIYYYFEILNFAFFNIIPT